MDVASLIEFYIADCYITTKSAGCIGTTAIPHGSFTVRVAPRELTLSYHVGGASTPLTATYTFPPLMGSVSTYLIGTTLAYTVY